MPVPSATPVVVAATGAATGRSAVPLPSCGVAEVVEAVVVSPTSLGKGSYAKPRRMALLAASPVGDAPTEAGTRTAAGPAVSVVCGAVGPIRSGPDLVRYDPYVGASRASLVATSQAASVRSGSLSTGPRPHSVVVGT